MLRRITKEDQLIDDLVGQFLTIKNNPRAAMRSTTREDDTNNLRITGAGDDIQIVYSFTATEVKILRIIQQVTGAPMPWLAADAIGWARSYIDDLVTDGTGQLEDLIDKDDGGVCPIGAKFESRTRLFLKRVQRARTVQRLEAA